MPSTTSPLLSAAAIARRFQVDTTTVWRAIRRAGVKPDNISPRGYRYYGEAALPLIRARIPSIAYRD